MFARCRALPWQGLCAIYHAKGICRAALPEVVRFGTEAVVRQWLGQWPFSYRDTRLGMHPVAGPRVEGSRERNTEGVNYVGAPYCGEGSYGQSVLPPGNG